MEVKADDQQTAERKALGGLGEWLDFPKIHTQIEYIKEVTKEDIKNGRDNNHINSDDIKPGG
jgi:hypothetical protein